jgi:dihydropteroate synthase
MAAHHSMEGKSFPRPIEIRSTAEARCIMSSIGVGVAGCDIMAPKAVFRSVRISNVPLKAALLLKQEMLAKGGEAALPRATASLAVNDCPVVLTGTVRQFELVIGTLRRQPFGLRALADKIESVLERLETPPAPSCFRGRAVEWGRRTYIMGILNVTPDSFSDGGQFNSLERAIAHAQEMVEAGADFIDVGGESTRPGSVSPGAAEELDRVAPVVEWLASNTNVLVSVDTYRASVAAECLRLGAHVINDITAASDEATAQAAAAAGAGMVLMHMKGTPTDMQDAPEYEDVVGEVYDYLNERVTRVHDLGVERTNCIIDPGIGFGKLVEHNLQLLRRIGEFAGLGVPVLVGTSRKSTIARVTGAATMEERVYGTAATVALAIASGADIVRVHDVREMAMVARMSDAITR